MIVDNQTTLEIFASRYLETLTTSELIDWLDDINPEVRTLVARKLHCKGTKEVFDLAGGWAVSTVHYQREIAAFLLGQLGCLSECKYPFKTESKTILIDLINDENNEVRAAAVAACGHLYREGLDSDLEALILGYSNDDCTEVRISIAVTLGNSSGSENVRLVYASYLEDDEIAEWAEVGLEILEDRLNNR